MKTIKNLFKSVALILSLLILLQGCTVYKSVPVSLEQATKNETKVKIMTKNNVKLKFKRIDFENEEYYGINEIYKDDAFNQSKKEIIKTHLDINNIKTIKIKDKTMSTILPFAIPVTLFGILLGSVALWY